MKSKRFLLLNLLLLVTLCSFTYAATDLSINLTLEYDFQTLDGLLIDDLQGTVDANIVGAIPANSTSCLIGSCYYLDFSKGDYFYSDSTATYNGYMTFEFWIRNFDIAGNTFQALFERGSNKEFSIHTETGISEFNGLVIDGGNTADWTVNSHLTDANSVSDGDWHQLILTFDYVNSEIKTYRDSILIDTNNDVDINGMTFSDSVIYLGSRFAGTTNYWGFLDNFRIWEDVKTQPDITRLYNNGEGMNRAQLLDSGQNVTVNDSIESTVVVKQINPITLLGSTPSTIFSSNIEIFNTTTTYGAYSLEIISIQSNQLFCELSFNNTVVGNLTRDNTPGDIGNGFIMSTLVELVPGNYTQELVCMKSSGLGRILIDQAVGIGHFLLDEGGFELPHSELIFDSNVVSGGSFTKIGEFNITTGKQNDTEKIHAIVLEGSMGYNNNAANENIATYISINDSFNCSMYPRFVSSGNTGSVSVDCALENVSLNTTYTISLYGNGTNANYEGNIVSKSFFLSDEEIAGGVGSLVGINFSGSVPIKLFNLTGGNVNHANTNVFEKISLSIVTDADTDVNIYINLSNGVTRLTKNFTRSFQQDEIGVLIGHDSFLNIPEDDYEISVWANCGGTTCHIVGGAGIGYITDVITTQSNAFNITLYNDWNNSPILIFNATNGATSSTTSGLILYFSPNNFENITIESNDYFDRVILDHNTSTNLNTSAWQSEIDILSFQAQTNTPISNYSVVYNGTTILNITGLNGTIRPNAGIYTMSVIDNSGLVDYVTTNNIFTVNSLSTITHSFILYDFILNITARDFITQLDINTFDAKVTSNVYGGTRTFNTTSGFIEVPVITDAYFVNVTAAGYAEDGAGKTIPITFSKSELFFLYEANSIFFQIFDLDSGNFIIGNTTLQLIGDTISYNKNTSNGSLYVDNLNIDTYRIITMVDNYDPTTIFATITGSNHLNIDIFMKNGTFIHFIIQDQIGDFQGNVTLTFTQNINGSKLTIGQIKTDFSGRASIYLQEDQEYTFFAVKDGFETFTGTVIPTQPEYLIKLSQIGGERFISVFEDLKYQTTFDYVPLSFIAEADFILNSAGGFLEFYGMDTTYKSMNYFINTTTIPAGGVQNFTIINVTPSTNPTINIVYWFKYSGRELVEWNTTYLLSDVILENITLEGGLFDELEDLDRTNAIRGIIGFILVITLIVIFSAATRNVTMGSIGGLIGLGLNFKYELLPKELLIVSMVVISILIFADNIGGRK